MTARPTRRQFLVGATAAAGAATLAPASFALATPNDPTQGDVIVLITLRGGLDGLSLTMPYGDDAYRSLRPTTRIGAPDEPDGAIDLGDGWGLHPSMAPIWNRAGVAGKLALIRSAGMPDYYSQVRSHFEAVEYWDRGERRTTGTGWAARHLRDVSGALTARSYGHATHPAFSGHRSVIAGNGTRLSFSAYDDRSRAFDAIAAGYGGSSPVALAGRSAVSAASALNAVDWSLYEAAPGIDYPRDSLAENLEVTAQMIRSGIGLQMAALGTGGYDTHGNQGNGGGGGLANRLDRLAGSLAAFWDDLGPSALDEVTVVVVTEFGRTMRENGDQGTDHGRGTTLMVMGNNVNGGLWGDPGPMDPEPGRNAWLVNHDFQTIINEVLAKRRGEGDPGHVFPVWRPEEFMGVVNA